MLDPAQTVDKDSPTKRIIIKGNFIDRAKFILSLNDHAAAQFLADLNEKDREMIYSAVSDVLAAPRETDRLRALYANQGPSACF